MILIQSQIELVKIHQETITDSHWKILHNIFETSSNKKMVFEDYKRRWHGVQFYYIIKNQNRLGYVLITPRNEIGYYLLPKYHRKGYGTDAVIKLMKKEKRKYYWAMIPSGNPRSDLFIQKLGFIEDGKVYSIDGV